MAYKPSWKSERLDDFLVLNTFINRLFGMKSFDNFQKLLKNVEEGFDDEGRSHVFNTLRSQKDIDPQLKSKLEEYDSNIKSYLDHINARQEPPIRLKYFQYLAVLFTETYLDRYFENPIKLMNELTPKPDELLYFQEKNRDFKPIYIPNDLKKLAYWMATGSGKTFLLHINYLQFMKYNKGRHKIELDNILLITPNESLSSQHMEEMRKSGIPCELFQSQNLGAFSQYADHNVVKIIDIHKLTEEKKGQGVTVDIENFGRKNLIFVDEGHKGSGGQKWKYFREELAKEGFNFEYSATFGQAVAATNGNDDLLNKYGKSIIFDYSYRYFYNDGYGKEYSIMNLKDAKYSESTKQTIMLANLLTLYEQKLIFNKHSTEIEPYNIEDPLWIFVGSKVQGKQNQSDILEVVRFLDLVLKNEGNWAIDSIGDILKGNSGLKDKITGYDLFSPSYPEQRLAYLRSSKPDDIYKDMLKLIFHSENPAPLHLLNLKNAAGEIALRCGLNEFFGVINIGDDAQFIKLVETETKIQVIKDDISSGSLFNTINQQSSKVNVLIGAKKFIEGWNSWRVSNMGLLNIGKSEGTQIIQLFGRGVRLKGKKNSLKRSKAIEEYPPPNLHILERLNIFGIEANYMDQFKMYLETEGVHTENSLELSIPIQINESFLKEGLLYPYVDKKRFKKEEFYELKFDPDTRQVEIDLLPKIEMIESQKQPGISTQSQTKPKTIDHKYLDMLDWSRVYFSLLEFRVLKSWNNIVFSKETLRSIVEKDQAAYSLKCLEADINPTRFEDVRHLEEIVVSILKKYLQSYHDRHRNIWTKKNLDVLKLDKSNGNFEFREFKVRIGDKNPALIEEFQNFKPPYEKGIKIGHVYFDRHLFQPLFLKDEGTSPMYETIPVGLNEGERKFIEDLKRYAAEKRTEFSEHRKMFVLRNLPKVGIGFFIKTVNYYPDFIVWIKTDDMQQIIFADPKGLTHITNGFEDEKIQLYEHLKDMGEILSKKLLDRGEKQKIKLDSYVISVTPIRGIQPIFHTGQQSTLIEHHILVQEENGKYIGKMLSGE